MAKIKTKNVYLGHKAEASVGHSGKLDRTNVGEHPKPTEVNGTSVDAAHIEELRKPNPGKRFNIDREYASGHALVAIRERKASPDLIRDTRRAVTTAQQMTRVNKLCNHLRAVHKGWSPGAIMVEAFRLLHLETP